MHYTRHGSRLTMKLTSKQLRQIISEEMKTLSEGMGSQDPAEDSPSKGPQSPLMKHDTQLNDALLQKLEDIRALLQSINEKS